MPSKQKVIKGIVSNSYNEKEFLDDLCTGKIPKLSFYNTEYIENLGINQYTYDDYSFELISRDDVKKIYSYYESFGNVKFKTYTYIKYEDGYIFISSFSYDEKREQYDSTEILTYIKSVSSIK